MNKNKLFYKLKTKSIVRHLVIEVSDNNLYEEMEKNKDKIKITHISDLDYDELLQVGPKFKIESGFFEACKNPAAVILNILNTPRNKNMDGEEID